MAKTRRPKTQRKAEVPGEIFVITEENAAGIQKFAADKSIPVDKLREHLRNFTGALSSALDSVQTLTGEFQLSEVQVTATLSAEVGFVWVTKAGVEGGVTLTFARKR
jgi:hypothetical protein